MGPLSAPLGTALLGVIQGLTEFLPVSSSGHLVVGQQILALAKPSLLLDVILHLGTLLPVLWLYRSDLAAMARSLARVPSLGEHWREDAALRLTVCVIIGSLPTAACGLLLGGLFERLFSSTLAVGITFALTGGILLLTRLARPPDAEEAHLTLTPLKALAVGLAQGAAITPGISRSGTTIAAGLLMGVERELAARFSFVLSIPAILGAVALHLRHARGGAEAGLFALGAAAAAVSGYLALRWVVRLVRQGELHWFSFYLWPLSAAVIAYTLLR